MSDDPIPPLPQHPKPKSKGQKPATPKLKVGPSVDPLDVFETAMNADAGAGSSSSSAETFDRFISYMSRSQLDQVDKLVQQVQTKVLSSEEEEHNRERTCKRISDATAQRRERSVTAEANIRQRVQARLDQLEISEVRFSKSMRLQSLEIANKRISVQKLVRSCLHHELLAIEAAIADGSLLIERKGQTALSIMRRMIEQHLTDDKTKGVTRVDDSR